MAALRVVQAGLSTTVQDLGRVGFRGFGVPVGGAFDRASLKLANALVGNELDAAALEMTLVGGTYQALVPLAIALAGAPMTAVIRPRSGPGRRLLIPQSASLQIGDELVIGGTPVGARAYLAVEGGWQTPRILESRSSERRLAVGEVLEARPGQARTRRPIAWPWRVGGDSGPIRVIDGPDLEGGGTWLEGRRDVVSSRSDRMGLRLTGPPLLVTQPADRASAPVAPGAVQVAGEQAIILGIAGGTMGGYPHLAHVITADLDRLAQLRPGEVVRFQRIELEDARRIDRETRHTQARWLTVIRAVSSEGRGT